MKKDFLKKVKGAILSKDEAMTISGGYVNGSFNPSGPCSFIYCGGFANVGAPVATPKGCVAARLYIYRPNPSLYCQA